MKMNPSLSKGIDELVVPEAVGRKIELLERRINGEDILNLQSNSQVNTNNSNQSRTSNQSGIASFFDKSDSRKGFKNTASYEIVNKAVDIQLQKVMKESSNSSNPTRADDDIVIPSSQASGQGGSGLSQASGQGGSGHSHSSSNQTYITSHLNVRSNEIDPKYETPPPSDAKTKSRILTSSVAKKIKLSPSGSKGTESKISTSKPTSNRKRSVPVRNNPTSSSTGTQRKRGRQKHSQAIPENNTNNNVSSSINAISAAPQSVVNETTIPNSGSNSARIKNTSKKSNPNSYSQATNSAPPMNNKLIHDFFERKQPMKDNELKISFDSEKVLANQVPTNPKSKKSTGQDDTRDFSLKEFERLQNQCLILEKNLSDKEEQLKAVSNNQTIQQNQLQAQLNQKESEVKVLEKELAKSSKKAEQRLTQALALIETLVSEKNLNERKQVRQKLASDGARLGKLVHTRTNIGMSVESWEEGYAFISLSKRRQAIKEKRQRLDNLKHEFDITKEKMDKLQRLEEQEGLYRSYMTLENEEVALWKDEQTLKIEKHSHIRALKRVASEEGSRFRKKFKLNNRYLLLNLLGKGGFSEVWRAFDLQGLRDVAVKVHQVDPRWSEAKKENYTKHVSREYEIHHEIRHPRIVSLFDVFEIDEDSFATVLEYCEGTDLEALLKERKNIPEREARSILIQILSGMQYLCSPSEDGLKKGIIHYDLKPGNILFDKFGDAKITDFGLSKIVEASNPADSLELTSQGAGTYWYLPPECFFVDQNVKISNKVDVWSIGVIYFEMLFGRRPFGEGQTQDKLVSNHTILNAREVIFPSQPIISSECKQFIQQCLTYEQTYRPTISQLCTHTYFELLL